MIKVDLFNLKIGDAITYEYDIFEKGEPRKEGGDIHASIVIGTPIFCELEKQWEDFRYIITDQSGSRNSFEMTDKDSSWRVKKLNVNVFDYAEKFYSELNNND